MQFPNAQEGIKKVYKSEILLLITSICSAIISIVGAITLAVANQTNDVGSALAGFGIVAILGIAVMIVALVALIMQLSGLSKAALDDQNFKLAMIFVIAQLFIQIMNALFQDDGIMKQIFDTLQNALGFFAVVYIVRGIQSLAAKLDDQEMISKGNRILYLILIIYVATIVVGWLTIAITTIPVVVVIFAVAVLVLSVVQYFIYLKYLSKARTMLEK